MTVSDQCCITCNGTTVPENTYIDTEQSQDKCGTVKTSYCRNLPSKIAFLHTIFKLNIILLDDPKAVIEYSVKHKSCCSDYQGK